MKAIFNSRIINSSDSIIQTDNRAFCYGDGLFETIVTGDRRINLIEKHLGRLQRGCQVMGIEFPPNLAHISIEKEINELREVNQIEGDTRAKLLLWRNSGGLYTPSASEASYYLEVKPSESQIFQDLRRAGFSEDFNTQYSPISFAKTTNALTYVLAGREKQSRGLDDIILTDSQGNLSETHISNLFWIKNKEVFTPKIASGCVEGIMRNTIISLLAEFEIQVTEVIEKKEVLAEADSVFATNASGIKYFRQIDDWSYEDPENFLKDIITRLQHP